MKAGPPRRRRARPVADAPIDALLERSEDLAKGWLLAMLEEAPLEDAPAIMAGSLPSEGPRLCAAVVRALADDGALRRLEPHDELGPLAASAGWLVGAGAIHDTARAIDALQSVLWSAVREELSYADSDLISELAERLALVIELVRVAALTHCATGVGAAPATGVEPPGAGAEPAAPPEAAEPAVGPSALPEPQAAPHGPADDPGALWLSAFDDELERAASSGGPLSLLLADLDDAERVLAVEPDGEASATFGRFAQAVRSVVRRQDILACETETRAWIIARDTARAGAQALGGRIAQAVANAGTWRGAPLRVSVGVAVYGEDGRDSATLVETAEEGAFAAAASGIGIVRAVPPPAPEDDGPQLA